jgi:hypothetical protein
MKGKWFLAFLSIAVLFSFLGGCGSGNQPTPSPIPITTKTSTVPSPTLAPTFTPTISFTPLPTLSPDEAYAHLRSLLNDTANCRLPCWLGITPGQSTLQDVLTLVRTFSSVDSKKEYVETVTGNETFADIKILFPNENAIVEISPSYQMASNENRVSVAFVDTRADWYTDGQWGGYAFGYYAYNQLLKPYTLSGILSGYGAPAQIFILGVFRADIIGSVSQTPDAMDRFEVHLLYPDQGILMIYEMPVKGLGDNYLFCPSKSMITGYLLPPGNADNFYQTLHSFGGDLWSSYPPDWLYFKTPEKAFEMTIEQFDQFFLSNPESCLETPKSIWWPEDLWNELIKNP